MSYQSRANLNDPENKGFPISISQPKTPTKICILGGGFAGLYTALSLARLSWHKSLIPNITLIDKEERFLFTPFLYELITDEFRDWEIAPSFQKLLAKVKVKFCQGTVENINLKQREIHLKNQECLTYDYLVLSVGRKTFSSVVSEQEVETYPFRTLADAERLKQRLSGLELSPKPKISIAVIGGGPNGVELAGKLADRLQKRGQIYLIVRGQQILKGFSNFSRKVAYQSLASRGVQLKFQTQIQSVDHHHITLIEPEQQHKIPIDLVIETVGTQPREWLYHLDCQHNKRGQVLTTPTLQFIDYPEVFALGDLADIRNLQGQQVPATAQAAFQQGAATADNLKALIMGKSLKAFHYVHLGEMLTLGVREAIVSSFGINLSGLIACWVRTWVYILLRMPTVNHRLQVTQYRWKQGIKNLFKIPWKSSKFNFHKPL
ncbi:NAD(P)/FAD-dependent oxidoreductase [Planktothrix paucivesiculata]|uniref:FAD-dependent pyridine nucleotide-disulphide oxidoreductase n=1 Tax=Planktothrix paucivesiculata PCC 9631 TaxID=671071 RepID=A0A7Z9DV23_9CYAN|nr:FAD-dependent oxidoreductase [Planktothrix paucivesiculata]VXD11801.1 FAD-dependent pyridine nucleotide-disulphide oxidoreductase [Planktothrix paucivesiculata PCC 9631]